jgi:hypothetical protein
MCKTSKSLFPDVAQTYMLVAINARPERRFRIVGMYQLYSLEAECAIYGPAGLF